MSPSDIEAFDAVMRTGSTNQAAKFLGISQPAVSRAIARLAGTTGLTLFRHVGNKLIPTPEAQFLHLEVKRSFVGLDKLRARAMEIRQFGVGGLRLACYPALGLSFAPKVIKQFRDGDPTTHVTLSIASSSAVKEMVASGHVDIGIAADEIDVSRVKSQVFMTSSAVCVMPPSHRLAQADIVRPQDLSGEPIIALSPDDTVQKRIAKILADAGVEPRNVVETQYSETVCNLALEGVGVGLANSISYRASGYQNRGLVARPFEPTITFRALLISAAESVPSAKAEALVTALFRVRNRLSEFLL